LRAAGMTKLSKLEIAETSELQAPRPFAAGIYCRIV
jgi:hypothetical protein